MRIFDESKQTELKEIDREAGRLVPDRLFIAHHDAREASEEIGHYEVIREYKNGGKDVKWVVDKPAVTACEEHDEYEDILVFVPYTEEELSYRYSVRMVGELKEKLRETDYQAIKYAEGAISAEAYEDMRRVRQGWRDLINSFEAYIGGKHERVKQ